jgi:hypothetical protein
MEPCHDEELNLFIEEHYAASKDEYPANFPLSYCLLEAEQQKDQEVASLLCLSPKEYKTVT